MTRLLEGKWPGVPLAVVRLIYYPYFGFPVVVEGRRRPKQSLFSGLPSSEPRENAASSPPNPASFYSCASGDENTHAGCAAPTTGAATATDQGRNEEPEPGSVGSTPISIPERISIIVDLLEGQAAVTDITGEQLEALDDERICRCVGYQTADIRDTSNTDYPCRMPSSIPATTGLPSGRTLAARITIGEAYEKAISFLTFVAAKSKRLRRYASTIAPGAPVLILKPFWIIEICVRPDRPKVLVDAVTGEYHPIVG